MPDTFAMPPLPPNPKPPPIPAPPVGSPRRVREAPQPKIVPPPLQATIEDDDSWDEQPRSWRSMDHWLDSAPWLVSFFVHFIVLFAMGLITYTVQPGRVALHLDASMTEEDSTSPEMPQAMKSTELDRREGISALDQGTEMVSIEGAFDAPQIAAPDEEPAAGNIPAPTVSGNTAGTSEIARPTGGPTGGGLGGRGRDARPGLARRGGGSDDSEAAVERGLVWLAAHQGEDGGWSFDLNKPPCNGLCHNSGSESSTTAATALALLPFLGAGYTHTEGEHQEVVKRGLYYLGTRARVTSNGVDLQEGTMYGQALATIVLCESYSMTHDPALKDVAQQALQFIAYAQNTSDGGWRYTPGAPGDMTVTGWQLMALKSGQMAKLFVPSPTIALVRKFLDRVQFEGGARYGYLTPTMRAKTHEVTTAVGLLCRMYTGWHRDNPAMYQGIAYLRKWGPSKDNMYFNYYAAQVLHNWEGPEWKTWNIQMRDYLVATQSKSSHEAGSWYFPDPYGDKAGRLYNTALAILTLEVYYRYLPLYRDEAVNDDF